MAEASLLTSTADGVARSTLDRPEVRNALSRALIAGERASFFEKRAPKWTGR
jgi:enoyl-CoA hydratase/carnithine racemase